MHEPPARVANTPRFRRPKRHSKQGAWDLSFLVRGPKRSCALSFIYVGIYWNNHHHMLHSAHKVSGAVLWANLHLLFWLSLFPFATAWMGESHLSAAPSAAYGVVLLMAALAYYVLQTVLVRVNGPDSLIARAIGQKDWKGKLSPVVYMVAIPLAFVSTWIAAALYVFIALIWLVPDRRIERLT